MIYISADHRGFELKQELTKWLNSSEMQQTLKALQQEKVVDCGNDHLDPDDDYVDFGAKVAHKVQHDPQGLGIVLCGSGIGISIAANRVKGIRCGLCKNPEVAKHGRQNDHINVLALAADNLDLHEAKDIVKTFLSTQPSPKEKYIRRKNKLDQI